MKMSDGLYRRLTAALDAAWNATTSGQRHNMRMAIACDPRVKDEKKRERWDWLWAAKNRDRPALEAFFRTAYDTERLDDSHIDTALKKWASAKGPS